MISKSAGLVDESIGRRLLVIYGCSHFSPKVKMVGTSMHRSKLTLNLILRVTSRYIFPDGTKLPLNLTVKL
jgi:hypothetical protein